MRYSKWLGALYVLGCLCLQTGQVQAAPESGWWWNPSESGRGFSIDIQGGSLFMAGYLYDSSGRSTWLSSGGAMQSTTAYQGSLQGYRGGQTLTGAYQPATATSPSPGNISLQFSDDTHGTLTWPGGTIPIERFMFGSGTSSFQPETGWWWNSSESGRGFYIEKQGTTLFIAGYMYDGSGNPVWYSSGNVMASPTLYQGNWSEYRNGQTLTGAYKAPSAPTNAGSVTLQFTSSTAATLTLPNGVQKQLSRFYITAAGSNYLGWLTGNSPDQAKFISARGYPHVFTLGFVNEELNSFGLVAPLTPPRRIETWAYNGANFTTALFENGFFISQETLGARTTLQSTNLKPTQFIQGMTEAQVIAVMGRQPDCVQTQDIAGKTIRYLRYKPTTQASATGIALENGSLASVLAGYVLVDPGQTVANICP